MLRKSLSLFGSRVSLNSALRRCPVHFAGGVTASVYPTPEVPTPMFCFQCEQTSKNVGCTSVGVCGKQFGAASMHDLSLWSNCQLGRALQAAGGDGTLPEAVREAVRSQLLTSTMATLSNVNFDEQRIADHIVDTHKLYAEVVKCSPAAGALELHFAEDWDSRLASARAVGIHARRPQFQSEDCFGMRELALNGLSGTVAYLKHAEYIRCERSSVYSESERSAVFDSIYSAYGRLADYSQHLDYYMQVAMDVGAANVAVMELLDRSHSALFGTQTPATVSATPRPGKCVLLSGHDIRDVARVCDVVAAKGLDIGVYTHGELLPAHAYPKLQAHSALKAHFGNAWQKQVVEFKKFPGPIVMTSNCLMPPRRSYKHRVFTTNAMGYEGLEHVNLYSEVEIMKVLRMAQELPGFTEETIAPWVAAKPHVVGFGHSALLSHAETIIDAIKSGALTDIFVIGGCDGSEPTRSYFKDLANLTPETSLILTLGCGKFRLRDCDLGYLGDSGIPRILDLGQCNDAYSGVVVALRLAEALGTDIHSLPLHFAVSWFEQKATAVALSLLHLGVQNIKYGPALPAFLNANLRQLLKDAFNFQQVNLQSPAADLKQFLSQPMKTQRRHQRRRTTQTTEDSETARV